MRYTLFTECNTYAKLSKFENVKGEQFGNQLTLELTYRKVSRSGKTIKAGKTFVTDGEKLWRITGFHFEDKRPKNLIATIEEIHHETHS